MFDDVDGPSITGGGIMDGNGKIWWQNSCKTNSTLLRWCLNSRALIYIPNSRTKYKLVAYLIHR
jgi:hypothetical protein